MQQESKETDDLCDSLVFQSGDVDALQLTMPSCIENAPAESTKAVMFVHLRHSQNNPSGAASSNLIDVFEECRDAFQLSAWIRE